MPQIGEIKRGKELGRHPKSGTRYIWHACIDCGKERWIPLIKDGGQRLRCINCSRIFNGINRRGKRWGKGEKRHSRGYSLIRLYPENFFYPMTQARDNYVFEHRLVIAKHLNRCLLPWEVVHHKNGIKDDNRIENLELLPTSKYHMVDSHIKAYIHRLENKIQQQSQQIQLLKCQIKGGTKC